MLCVCVGSMQKVVYEAYHRTIVGWLCWKKMFSFQKVLDVVWVTCQKVNLRPMQLIALDLYLIQHKKFNSSDVLVMINQWQMVFRRQKRLDFDDFRSWLDEECKIFTSVSKVQFDDLALHLSESMIRNSSDRSIRTALAILLMKLRIGLSNRVLAVLFQLPSNRAVSRSLEKCPKWIDESICIDEYWIQSHYARWNYSTPYIDNRSPAHVSWWTWHSHCCHRWSIYLHSSKVISS